MNKATFKLLSRVFVFFCFSFNLLISASYAQSEGQPPSSTITTTTSTPAESPGLVNDTVTNVFRMLGGRVKVKIHGEIGQK